MAKKATSSADYILPLYMNGLRGRVLKMPPPKGKKDEVLFIYGHHASLERYIGVAELMNQHSGVTMPDLPGFGGMDSFYSIGEKATLDNMADYLASFIKFRYKGQKFSVAGFSMGFMIITRMLQKYPELAKQIKILTSVGGLTHKDDFRLKRRTLSTMHLLTTICSLALPAAFVRYIVLRPTFLRLGYRYLEPYFIDSRYSKIRDVNSEEYKQRVEFEIGLWRSNDVRTYMRLATTMFRLNLTGEHVNLPVHHVAMNIDRYFDRVKVEEHMRQIFKDFHLYKVRVSAHAPTVIASAKDAKPFFPKALLKKL